MNQEQNYKQWLRDFFNIKSNELQYAQVQQPKRVEKKVLSLAVAQTTPLEVTIPFKTVWAARFFTTSSGVNVDGNVNIMFDEENISNISNSMRLNPSDSIRTGVACRRSFLTWTAQADTSVELYFFPDIEVLPGTTKTVILGTISANITSNKYPVPLSTTAYLQTAAGAGTWVTVPVGQIARVQFNLISTGGVASAGIISGTNACTANTAAATSVSVCTPIITVPAGGTIGYNNAGAGASVNATVELYTA